MKTLMIFTGSYPYSVAAENTFVPPELHELKSRFDRLILVPAALGGTRAEVEGERESIIVVTDYAEQLASGGVRMRAALAGLKDRIFIEECVSHRRDLIRKPAAIKRIVAYYVKARITQQWIRRYYEVNRKSLGDTILYSWWFDGTALGLSLFAKDAALPVVSRCHNFDVYESRFDPPFIPFRRLSLERTTFVCADSVAGATHIATTYPASSDRVGVALMGVPDPGFLASPSTDGVTRVVSCSFIAPVKRVDLIAKAVAEAGQRWPESEFRWTHVGVPITEQLSEFVRSIMPANVTYALREYRGNTDLLEFYRSQPTDVFINLSSHEGTPVAIMEAISLGIPVIATAVGGNGEIVGNENGILVSADPSPEEVAEAIGAFRTFDGRTARMRAASRECWVRRYDARKNYGDLANHLARMSGAAFDGVSSRPDAPDSRAQLEAVSPSRRLRP